MIGLHGNSYGVDHDYNSARGSGTTRGGSIVGFNPETGDVRWQTPLTGDSTFVGDPPGTGLLNNVVEALFGASLESDDPAAAFGAPSCAGRTCFWGSMGEKGIILATDTTTGRTIWERPANGSVLWGGAIVQLPEGIFYYVGSGYASFTTGKAAGPGPNFWAYKIPAE